MPDSNRPVRTALRASADMIVATAAGSLVVFVFYPITLCATGIKSLVAMVRPRRDRVRQSYPIHSKM
jgi:hypothetical protein